MLPLMRLARSPRIANEHPKAFCALLGKILPTQVTGADDGPGELGDARDRVHGRKQPGLTS
jgi:hypothetical protein